MAFLGYGAAREAARYAAANRALLADSGLTKRDTVTPYATGEALIDEWRVPPENRFIWRRGHFSVPLRMIRDHRPLRRLGERLESLRASR